MSIRELMSKRVVFLGSQFLARIHGQCVALLPGKGFKLANRKIFLAQLNDVNPAPSCLCDLRK